MVTEGKKRVLIWAMEVDIEGRRQAVRNSRRVLLWIAADAHRSGEVWQTTGLRTHDLVRGLRMPRSTVYVSLERLLNQQLLKERSTWRPPTRQFQLGYSPE